MKGERVEAVHVFKLLTVDVACHGQLSDGDPETDGDGYFKQSAIQGEKVVRQYIPNVLSPLVFTI